MTRFFMMEPGVLIAQQDHGPTRFDGAERHTAPSVAELASGLAGSITKSRQLLSEAITPTTRPTTPQGTGGGQERAPVDFIGAVTKLTELGMNYGDACVLASKEAPELYAKYVEDSSLN